jgi:hypothetical protein
MEKDRIYSPNSVHHGCLIRSLTKEQFLVIEKERTADFIEWLFDNHIDISQSKAWKEFENFELNQATNERKSKKRSTGKSNRAH